MSLKKRRPLRLLERLAFSLTNVLFSHAFLKLKEGMLFVYRRRCVGLYLIGSRVQISIKNHPKRLRDPTSLLIRSYSDVGFEFSNRSRMRWGMISCTISLRSLPAASLSK